MECEKSVLAEAQSVGGELFLRMQPHCYESAYSSTSLKIALVTAVAARGDADSATMSVIRPCGIRSA